MANEVKLPELGEGIEGAQVLTVLVALGDTVRKDQTVIEVETEKATAEVPSDFAGVVSEIMVAKGDQITVGQTILALEGGAETPVAITPAPEPEKKPEAVPEPEKKAEAVPDPVPLAASPSSDSKSAETQKPTPEESKKPTAETLRPENIVYLDEATGTAPAAPSVRRLARELGVPIDQVEGTSSGGRISETDVKTFARTLINKGASLAPVKASRTNAPGHTKPSQPTLPDFTQWGEIERTPLSMVRKATANAMSNAWANVPMVTQFDRADITELDAFRRQYSKKANTKLTVTAIATKVAASALKVFPQFNASLDLEHEEIIHKQYINIGVAVDTDRGLLVPVLRNVDQKNVLQLSEELNDAAARARDRKSSLDELRGGTFSISNLGGLGTTYFSPIVNWPEVAILGMGRATQEAIYLDGQFVPRSMLPLAVTYDHRLIDGADAARFLRWIAAALEQPLLLAIEG